MFGGRKGKDKTKAERPKRAPGGGLAQFGLMDVPGSRLIYAFLSQ